MYSSFLFVSVEQEEPSVQAVLAFPDERTTFSPFLQDIVGRRGLSDETAGKLVIHREDYKEVGYFSPLSYPIALNAWDSFLEVFTTLDTSTIWQEINSAGADSAAASGTLQQSLDGTSTSQSTVVVTRTPYDLYNSAVYAQLVNPGSGITGYERFMQLRAAPNSGDGVWFLVDGSALTLSAVVFINGVTTVLATIAYSGSTMPMLQIAADDTNVFWQYAASSDGPWTTLANYPFSNVPFVRNSYLQLQTDHVSGSTALTATWDNINAIVTVGTQVSSGDSGSGSEATTLVAQVSASDVSGATSETLALTVVAAPIDGNGTTTESATLALVGSDTNGATAETGSINVPISASDTNGSTTEATIEAAQFSGSDASGAINENGVVTYQAASSDANGTTAEAASAGQSINVSDANSITTENGFLAAAQFTSSDSGSGTDFALAGNTPKQDIDLGAGSEGSIFIVASVPASDSAGASEAASEVTRPITGDSASSSDSQALTAALSASETASAIETALELASRVAADAGVAFDAQLVTIQVIAADSGTSSETQTIPHLSFPSVDTGGASENFDIVAFVLDIDAWTGDDIGTVDMFGAATPGDRHLLVGTEVEVGSLLSVKVARIPTPELEGVT